MFYDFSKVHGLVACGGDDGYVECFDTRTKPSIGRINAVAAGGDIDQVKLSFIHVSGLKVSCNFFLVLLL